MGKPFIHAVIAIDAAAAKVTELRLFSSEDEARDYAGKQAADYNESVYGGLYYVHSVKDGAAVADDSYRDVYAWRVALVTEEAYDARRIAEALQPDILDAAYRKQELSYRTQDVMCHFEDLRLRGDIPEDSEMSEEDARELAMTFLYEVQDCNLAENDQLDELVTGFFQKGGDTDV